jgi:HD domain
MMTVSSATASTLRRAGMCQGYQTSPVCPIRPYPERVKTTVRQGLLSERFDKALTYAVEAHDTQVRKGTKVPYVAHLLGVASIVLEAGGIEVEAIAALLHDVVEDQGGAKRLRHLRTTFGDQIAEIVRECSAEDKTEGDPGWRARKIRYIDGIATVSRAALLVSLADKLYNARAILADYQAIGDQVWKRFNADVPKDESVLWYYESLLAAYADRLTNRHLRRLHGELSSVVGQLRAIALGPACPTCVRGHARRVVYGMPTFEAVQSAEADGVVYAGCTAGFDDPDLSCGGCGHRWRDEGPQA